MARKLTRNMSTKESRDWWAGVLAAGAQAPEVDMTPTPYPKHTSRPTRASASDARTRRRAKR
jgi:hypothetical protein